MDERTTSVDDSDDGKNRRTAEIRSDIEDTRAEMAETIDAIQDKLRPSHIVADATDRIKAAATARVRGVAETAGEAANEMMERTRDTAGGLMERIQQNPYPAMLIGAGLIWWMRSERSTDRDREMRRWDDRGRWAAYESEQSSYADGDDRTGQRTRAVGAKAREYADDAREYVDETSQHLRQTGRRLQNQMQRTMTQNPLLVGAGALLVGLAFGMAVPETEVENEWMGEARDQVVEKAQQMAGDAATRVEQTASEVADAASQIAKSVTGTS